jgi:hypothetical protein
MHLIELPNGKVIPTFTDDNERVPLRDTDLLALCAQVPHLQAVFEELQHYRILAGREE